MLKNQLIRLALLSVLLVSSCTDTGEEGPLGTDSVTLHNAGQLSFWYVAVERELSHRMDPALSFLISESNSRLVAPGHSVSARIEGYAVGKDVRFFIYRPNKTDATRAYLEEFLDVSAKNLEAKGNTVVIGDPGDTILY